MRNWEKNILYRVVTRLEVGSVKTFVKQFDPNAFINAPAVLNAEIDVLKKINFY